MNKFTIIVSTLCRTNSSNYTVTNLHRVTANTPEDIINSEYGDDTIFIFQGWPLQEGELTENGYNLPIVQL